MSSQSSLDPRTIEVSGKSVEEAVSAGLTQLGLDRLDVRVEVLEEGSKGFLGLFSKPARVRITERRVEPDFDMDEILRPGASTRVSTVADVPEREPRREKKAQQKPQPKPEQADEAQQKPVQKQPKADKPQRDKGDRQGDVKAAQDKSQNKPQREKPAQQDQEHKRPEPAKASNETQHDDERRPERSDAHKNQARDTEAAPADQPETPAADNRQRKPRPQKQGGEQRKQRPADSARGQHGDKPKREGKPHAEPPRPVIPEGPLPDQDIEALSDAAKRARVYLERVTGLMGVDVKIYIAEAEGAMSISMMGDTLGILIGRRGDTLDALQYLTSLEVNKGEGEYIRVTLDTENYRAKREDSLEKYAYRMAQRAVKTGRRVVLDPMNPYERRVLHATLQDHPDVETHSEGDEPNRRVVITLKREAAEAALEDEYEDDRPYRTRVRNNRRDGGRPRYNKSRSGSRPHNSSKPDSAASEPAAAPQVMAHDVPVDPEDDTI